MSSVPPFFVFPFLLPAPSDFHHKNGGRRDRDGFPNFGFSYVGKGGISPDRRFESYLFSML